MRWVKNQIEAGKELGVSADTIRKWKAGAAWWQDRFYQKGKGWDVDSIRDANPRYANEEETQQRSDVARQISIRAKEVDLKIKESKLAERRRQLIDVDLMIQIVTDHDRILAHNCTQIPLQLSKLTKNKQLKKLLNEKGQNIVRKLLRAASADLRAELTRTANA